MPGSELMKGINPFLRRVSISRFQSWGMEDLSNDPWVLDDCEADDANDEVREEALDVASYRRRGTPETRGFREGCGGG